MSSQAHVAFKGHSMVHMGHSVGHMCVWCYRLVSGLVLPHRYDDPLHC